MSSAEDNALCELFDRMVPGLKRAILRDSDKRPEALSLEIVPVSSELLSKRHPA
jgi:hypothetical protein